MTLSNKKYVRGLHVHVPNFLYIEVDQVNETEHYRLNEPEFHQTIYFDKNLLYKALLKEYGRCIGKSYVDQPKGKRKQIGWCFQKKQAYTDSKDKFTLTTWVSVHVREPDVEVIRYYYTEF